MTRRILFLSCILCVCTVAHERFFFYYTGMNFSSFLKLVVQLIGSLGFLLYGMKMMSDGIQKSAGNRLKKALGFMTGNRFLALLTGMILTMIIQSSGATTVMVVSFVNAGLLTLTQSVGVIFGANIGTTITAWIVALFGFSFSISSFAIPIFGFGYILSAVKKIHKENLGQALMGFALLFCGLDMLSSTVSPDSGNLNFMSALDDWGFLSILIGVVIGILITALLHSSSATTAIVITMAFNKLLSWEFSASIVIGSEIGSTIDAVLAAWTSKDNAKRAAFIHVMFNVVMAVLAIVFFTPLLRLVDFLVPGTVDSNITYHIAMLHTTLKTVMALVLLPFTHQIAGFAEQIIRSKEVEQKNVYVLEFSETGGKENAAAYLLRAEKEISDMGDLVGKMFRRVQTGFTDRTENFIAKHFQTLTEQEDYADQMKEQLTKYLVACSRLPLSESQSGDISRKMQIVDDLESMSDECYSIAVLLKRTIDKNMRFTEEDLNRLVPYMSLAGKSFEVVRAGMDNKVGEAQFAQAQGIEDDIDAQRKSLKKVARKRLEEGADVKTELLYIDLVRQIEKFGDRAYSISEALSQSEA